MTYLIDTCILSKLRKIKSQPDVQLENWLVSCDESQFYLSTLTIGEIQQGISKLADEYVKRILEEWLYGHVISRFKERILPLDLKVCLKWGELSGYYKQKGLTLPVVDTLIASTAIVHDLIIVTENIQDFSKIKEAKIFNPCE